MSARYYYLGPWLATEENGVVVYMPPANTVGLVDLRPLSATSDYGFFATSEPLADEAYEAFGDQQGTRLHELTMSGQQQSLWASMLGMQSIEGDTLLDLLWNTLTTHADPEGTTRALPLMPTHSGNLELWLGGHSLVRSRRFQGVADPAWPNIQRVVQRNYARIREHAQRPNAIEPNLHSKYVECMRRKLGVPWQSLVPRSLPQEPPRKPTTSYAEDWECSDDATGIDCDQTWIRKFGSTPGMVLTDGQAQNVDSVGTAYMLDGDLSSDDHSCGVLISHIEVPASPEDNIDTFVRFNPATTAFTGGVAEHYVGRTRWRHVSRVDWLVYKVVEGSLTSLGADNNIEVLTNLPFWQTMTVDGSNVILTVGSGTSGTITDTSITGWINCAIGADAGAHTPDSVGYIRLGEALIEDLVAGSFVDMAAATTPTVTISSPSLGVIRELAASIAPETTVNSPALGVTRDIAAGITPTATVNDPELSIVRELAAAIAPAAASNSPALSVVRVLAAAIAPTTEADAELSVGAVPTTTVATTTIPITRLWTPNRLLYMIVCTPEGLVFNPDTGEFDDLGGGSACLNGAGYAFALDEWECSPGVYRGAVDVPTEGVYEIIIYDQLDIEIDLLSDTLVALVAVDTRTDLTNANLYDVLIELQSLVNTTSSGSLTAHDRRMLTAIYQRKTNNQRR